MNDKDKLGLTDPIYEELPNDFLKVNSVMDFVGQILYEKLVALLLYFFNFKYTFNSIYSTFINKLMIQDQVKICFLYPQYRADECVLVFNLLIGYLYTYLYKKFKYEAIKYLIEYLNKKFHLMAYISYVLEHGEFNCVNPYEIPTLKSIKIIPNDQDTLNLDKILKLSEFFPYKFDYRLLNSFFNPRDKYYPINRYGIYGNFIEYIGDAVLDIIALSIAFTVYNDKNVEILYGILNSNDTLGDIFYNLGLCENKTNICSDRFEMIIGSIFMSTSEFSEFQYIDNWLRYLYIDRYIYEFHYRVPFNPIYYAPIYY